jgi:1-acyl-sn-glycerol-3-phosphate acyltransferase
MVPHSKKWLVDGFCRFTRRMAAKHFTVFGVQMDVDVHEIARDPRPLVVYANHVGWWDPVVAMLLRKQFFSNRILYAPIDAEQLAAYRVLKSMGFYGVKLDSYAGASNFLKTTREILSSPNASIWITPEGQFTDCRDHSKPLMPGLAHIAASVPRVIFLPLAIEYPFWDQIRPSMLVRFGAPIEFEQSASKTECSIRLHERLRETQRALAADVIARNSNRFQFLIASRAQRMTWYDYARSWAAWYRGQPFDPRHRGRSDDPSTS